MEIHERLRRCDIYTYNLIVKRYGFNPDKIEQDKKPKKKQQKKKGIKLGDSVENLMKHSSYRRQKGALRQTRWD